MGITTAFIIAHAGLLSRQDGMLVALGLSEFAPFNERRMINDELFDELNEISLNEGNLNREIANNLKTLMYERHLGKTEWYDESEIDQVMNNELGRIGLSEYVGNWRNRLSTVSYDLTVEIVHLSEEIKAKEHDEVSRYNRDDSLRRYVAAKECMNIINSIHYSR